MPKQPEFFLFSVALYGFLCLAVWVVRKVFTPSEKDGSAWGEFLLRMAALLFILNLIFARF